MGPIYLPSLFGPCRTKFNTFHLYIILLTSSKRLVWDTSVRTSIDGGLGEGTTRELPCKGENRRAKAVVDPYIPN